MKYFGALVFSFAKISSDEDKTDKFVGVIRDVSVQKETEKLRDDFEKAILYYYKKGTNLKKTLSYLDTKNLLIHFSSAVVTICPLRI